MDPKPALRRRLSPRGLALLKSFERGAGNFAAEPYDDGGVMKIGWGHRIFHGEVFTQPIDRTQADGILQQDARFAEICAGGLYLPEPLAQCEFDALVLLAFDIGAEALRKSTLVRRLRDTPRYPDAIAKQWMLLAEGQCALRRSCELLLFQGASDERIATTRAHLETLARQGSL